MSQLRERYIRDLKIRNYSPNTIKTYVSCIVQLAKHFDKCPSQISTEELKDYIDQLIQSGKSWSVVNQLISAVNRLQVDTLNNPYLLDNIKRPKNHVKIPTILSVEEVKSVINSIANQKHKAIIMTIYSAGLRISELCSLKISDIDANRKRIIIRNAKGHKDREAILSMHLLSELRSYFKAYNPQNYLFNGMIKGQKYSTASIRKILAKALKKAGIYKHKVTVHSLRHSYATHLMDKGIDLRVIQVLMGHKSIKTTLRYSHLSKNNFDHINSPLDDIIPH